MFAMTRSYYPAFGFLAPAGHSAHIEIDPSFTRQSHPREPEQPPAALRCASLAQEPPAAPPRRLAAGCSSASNSIVAPSGSPGKLDAVKRISERRSVVAAIGSGRSRCKRSKVPVGQTAKSLVWVHVAWVGHRRPPVAGAANGSLAAPAISLLRDGCAQSTVFLVRAWPTLPIRHLSVGCGLRYACNSAAATPISATPCGAPRSTPCRSACSAGSGST